VETKFHQQSSLVIGDEASRRLMELAWSLRELGDAGEVARRSVPRQPPAAAAGSR
jgi:hypothetical protein